jgi:malate dehydrogenase (oxaloacetate-decarboxylating)
LRGSKKENVRVVVNGAGAAGVAIVKLLIESGFQNIIMSDTKGAIYLGREDLDGAKLELAKVTNLAMGKGQLPDIINGADVFIGVSKGGVLNKEMVSKMAKDPIIFALANPEPEISFEDAKFASAFIVATGRSDYPNQVNNALAFPGIFRGALDNKIKNFEEHMFVKAAEALASCVANPTTEKIIPSIFDQNVVTEIAKVIK